MRWKGFSPESIQRFKFTNGVYLFFMFICLTGAFQLYRYPSRNSKMIWGLAVFMFSILALTMQHKGMQQEKRELGIP